MSAARALRRFVSVGLGTAGISLLLALAGAGGAVSLGLGAAAAGLLVIVALGVAFDVVGVAATAASEEPFHAMAADRVSGARHAIWIVRNADRVANFCNDMVGDAAGILSGAVGAAVVRELVARYPSTSEVWATTFMVAIVSGLAVGGKAAFKGFAMERAEEVVFALGRIMAAAERVADRLRWRPGPARRRKGAPAGRGPRGAPVRRRPR